MNAEATIRKRLEQAKAEQDLPSATDTANLAKYIAVISHGIALQAASGVDRKTLYKVVEIAIQAWPKTEN